MFILDIFQEVSLCSFPLVVFRCGTNGIYDHHCFRSFIKSLVSAQVMSCHDFIHIGYISNGLTSIKLLIQLTRGNVCCEISRPTNFTRHTSDTPCSREKLLVDSQHTG